MFVSLILAATLTVNDVPVSDQVTCPQFQRPPHAAQYPVTWLSPSAAIPYGFRGKAQPVTTAVSDRIGVSMAGARWFQAYAGGASNGEYALYDTTSGTFYICGHADTTHYFFAARMPLGWVARDVPAVAASLDFHTSRGIRLGDTPSQVPAVYGKGQLQSYGGYDVLLYTKSTKLDA